MGMRRLALVLLWLTCVARVHASPHVYVVIVDGLRPGAVTADRMPGLYGERPRARLFRRDARAVLPTRTNPNHVTLLTGVRPAAHGITGNVYWKTGGHDGLAKLDEPGAIEVETVFTVIRRARPGARTLGVFAKPKLGRLFAAVPGRQSGPGVLWSGLQASAGARDPASGYASDRATMNALLEGMAHEEPDLAVVGLADVDRIGHSKGPDSPEYADAVALADHEIRRLVDVVRAPGRWERSVIVVTADHGFSTVHSSLDVAGMLARADVTGVHVASDGGLAHLYAQEGTGGQMQLARAVQALLASPGIEAVILRRPVTTLPGLPLLGPRWQLDHPRAGDAIVIAAAGIQLIDDLQGVEAGFRGNHGGSHEQEVPLVVLGGYTGLADVPASSDAPDAADVGTTVAALLDLPSPRRFDGKPIADELRGHPIRGLLISGDSKVH